MKGSGVFVLVLWRLLLWAVFQPHSFFSHQQKSLFSKRLIIIYFGCRCLNHHYLMISAPRAFALACCKRKLNSFTKSGTEQFIKHVSTLITVSSGKKILHLIREIQSHSHWKFNEDLVFKQLEVLPPGIVCVTKHKKDDFHFKND